MPLRKHLYKDIGTSEGITVHEWLLSTVEFNFETLQSAATAKGWVANSYSTATSQSFTYTSLSTIFQNFSETATNIFSIFQEAFLPTIYISTTGAGEEPWRDISYQHRFFFSVTQDAPDEDNCPRVLLKVGESSTATGCDFHLYGLSADFPSAPGYSGDLTFYDQDGDKLEYFVENVVGSPPNRIAYVWLKILYAGNIWCYFGRTYSSVGTNPSSVFPIVGNFENGLDSGWQVSANAACTSASDSLVGGVASIAGLLLTDEGTYQWFYVTYTTSTVTSCQLIAYVQPSAEDVIAEIDVRNLSFGLDGRPTEGYSIVLPYSGSNTAKIVKLSGLYSTETVLATKYAQPSTAIARVKINCYGSEIYAAIERPVGTLLATLYTNAATDYTSGYIGASSYGPAAFDLIAAETYTVTASYGTTATTYETYTPTEEEIEWNPLTVKYSQTPSSCYAYVSES